MKRNPLTTCIIAVMVLLLTFIAGCSSGSDSDSTGSVTGQCKEGSDLSKYPIFPLSDVSVTHVETGKSTSTDDEGKFTINDLPEGTSTLNFEKDGYEKVSMSVEVKAGTTTTVTTDSHNSVMIPESSSGTPSKWTLFIYMAADNSLADDSTANINELEQLGSTSDVNIVVFLDKTGENSKLYFIKKDDDTTKITSPYYDFGANLDSGDYTIFREIVTSVSKYYPSSRFYLELWDHGQGIERKDNKTTRNICQDDTSGTHMTEEQVLSVLKELKMERRDIDIIACDACTMGNLEVAYEWKDYCTYFVASENSVPEEGFPYNTMLASLISNPDISNLDFVKNMVTEYGNYYKANGKGYETLSAIDMSKVDNLNSLVDTYTKALMQNGDASDIWSKAYRVCAFTGQRDLIDLYSFIYYEKNYCNATSTRGYADTEAQAVMDALIPAGDSKVIIANYSGPLFKEYFKNDACGLSIWGWFGGDIPEASPYKECLFYSNNKWPDFINWINQNH